MRSPTVPLVPVAYIRAEGSQRSTTEKTYTPARLSRKPGIPKLTMEQTEASLSHTERGRQAAAARSSLLCGAVQLGCTWALMGLPGVGLRGYVAGFVLSSALGALLNYREAARHTGLRPRLFQWCTAPALSALLMGLVLNLLFRVLRDAGMADPAACPACILFGGVLYLAALSAQGVRPSQLFRLK